MKYKELKIPCPACKSKSTVTYYIIDGFIKTVCKKCIYVWVDKANIKEE